MKKTKEVVKREVKSKANTKFQMNTIKAVEDEQAEYSYYSEEDAVEEEEQPQQAHQSSESECTNEEEQEKPQAVEIQSSVEEMSESETQEEKADHTSSYESSDEINESQHDQESKAKEIPKSDEESASESEESVVSNKVSEMAEEDSKSTYESESEDAKTGPVQPISESPEREYESESENEPEEAPELQNTEPEIVSDDNKSKPSKKHKHKKGVSKTTKNKTPQIKHKQKAPQPKTKSTLDQSSGLNQRQKRKTFKSQTEESNKATKEGLPAKTPKNFVKDTPNVLESTKAKTRKRKHKTAHVLRKKCETGTIHKVRESEAGVTGLLKNLQKTLSERKLSSEEAKQLTEIFVQNIVGSSFGGVLSHPQPETSEKKTTRVPKKNMIARESKTKSSKIKSGKVKTPNGTKKPHRVTNAKVSERISKTKSAVSSIAKPKKSSKSSQTLKKKTKDQINDKETFKEALPAKPARKRKSKVKVTEVTEAAEVAEAAGATGTTEAIAAPVLPETETKQPLKLKKRKRTHQAQKPVETKQETFVIESKSFLVPINESVPVASQSSQPVTLKGRRKKRTSRQAVPPTTAAHPTALETKKTTPDNLTTDLEKAAKNQEKTEQANSEKKTKRKSRKEHTGPKSKTSAASVQVQNKTSPGNKENVRAQKQKRKSKTEVAEEKEKERAKEKKSVTPKEEYKSMFEPESNEDKAVQQKIESVEATNHSLKEKHKEHVNRPNKEKSESDSYYSYSSNSTYRSVSVSKSKSESRTQNDNAADVPQNKGEQTVAEKPVSIKFSLKAKQVKPTEIKGQKAEKQHPEKRAGKQENNDKAAKSKNDQEKFLKETLRKTLEDIELLNEKEKELRKNQQEKAEQLKTLREGGAHHVYPAERQPQQRRSPKKADLFGKVEQKQRSLTPSSYSAYSYSSYSRTNSSDSKYSSESYDRKSRGRKKQYRKSDSKSKKSKEDLKKRFFEKSGSKGHEDDRSWVQSRTRSRSWLMGSVSRSDSYSYYDSSSYDRSSSEEKAKSRSKKDKTHSRKEEKSSKKSSDYERGEKSSSSYEKKKKKKQQDEKPIEITQHLMTHAISIGNVPATKSEIEVTEFFKKALNGMPVGELGLPFERLRKSQGYYLIEFKSENDTDYAFSRLKGIKMENRQLRVLRPKGYEQLERNESAVSDLGEIGVVLLKNMVQQEDFKSDKEYKEIHADIKRECRKFGALEKVVIPRETPTATVAEKLHVGCVFLKYEAMESAERAAKTLNNRKFNGRRISSFVMTPQDIKNDINVYDLIK